MTENVTLSGDISSYIQQY